MESLIVSLNAVAPMFFMMLLGYFLKGIRFFTDDALKQINALVFKVLLPLQLFRSAFQADLEEVVNIPFLLWNEGLVLLSFCILTLVSIRTVRESGKRAALLQGMFRGNIALVGMAIAETLFGAEQTGTMAIVVAVTVPVYNVLAVLALEMFQGGKMPLLRILKEIATNPLIIGCLCGLICNLIGLQIPTLLYSPMDSLASAATPVALFALGASFHMERVSADRRAILVGVLAKLVFLPLAALSVGAALGFRGVELGAMAITFAAPTSVSSFSMAQQMGADADLAASMVVFTGMFSCLTIFLWTFALLRLGLM